MKSEDVISLYENVSVITGKMLAAARAGDWDALIELEGNCARHIASLRDDERLVALSSEKRIHKVRIINEILAQDRQIRDLTTPWMAELANLINNAGSQRRLNQAYGA